MAIILKVSPSESKPINLYNIFNQKLALLFPLSISLRFSKIRAATELKCLLFTEISSEIEAKLQNY
jgi:hypothetical protein